MSPQISKAEVRMGGLPSRGTSSEVLQAPISVAKTKYLGSPKISKEKAATTALKALQLTF